MTASSSLATKKKKKKKKELLPDRSDSRIYIITFLSRVALLGGRYISRMYKERYMYIHVAVIVGVLCMPPCSQSPPLADKTWAPHQSIQPFHAAPMCLSRVPDEEMHKFGECPAMALLAKLDGLVPSTPIYSCLSLSSVSSH